MLLFRTPVRKSNASKSNVDGKNILHVVDHRGKNYYFLLDLDTAIDSDEVRIFGTFTTFPSPYNGKSPTFIDSTRLNGKPGSQYLHELENAYIPTAAISICEHETKALDSPEIIKHLNRIKIENNL